MAVISKTKVGTIDLTPTWVGMLPSLIMLRAEGNAEARMLADDELRRMAELADAYVAMTKEKKNG